MNQCKDRCDQLGVCQALASCVIKHPQFEALQKKVEAQRIAERDKELSRQLAIRQAAIKRWNKSRGRA